MLHVLLWSQGFLYRLKTMERNIKSDSYKSITSVINKLKNLRNQVAQAKQRHQVF